MEWSASRLKEELISYFNINNGEIRLIQIENNHGKIFSANVTLPYSSDEIQISFEGNNLAELKQDFVNNINQELENMIDHLGDCKL